MESRRFLRFLVVVSWALTISILYFKNDYGANNQAYVDEKQVLNATAATGPLNTSDHGNIHEVDDLHEIIVEVNSSSANFCQVCTNLSARKIPETSVLKMFNPRYDNELRKNLLEAVLIVNTTCMELGIDCFMDSGSLLGSYRLHNPLPWDLDFDMFVDVIGFEELKALLSKKGQIYEYNKESYMKFKVHKYKPYEKYNQVDIMAYKKGTTTIEGFREGKLFNISNIWPLTLRPYGGMWIPAPCKTAAFLKHEYGSLDMCETSKDKPECNAMDDNVCHVKCAVLNDYIPHIKRKYTDDETIMSETVMFQSKKVYSLDVGHCKENV